MSPRVFRLFLSSPGDVAVERRRVAAVVSRLNGEFAGRAQIETIRWELENYQAYATFQAQIPLATSCDIVLGIFKWRLGTELPPSFPDRLETGEPYPSGTAYELLTSMAQRQRGDPLPDVYAFRYTGSSPRLELDDPNRERIERDWALLKSFFDRWFLTPEGHFKSAFHSYGSEDDFEAQVEQLLRRWLADKVTAGRVVAWPDAVKGSPFPGLEAYGRRHASVFFGRARDVARGVEAWREAALNGSPALIVVGSSGAGKSSLARAGLVPRLTTPGVVEAVDLWRVAAMRPGDSQGGPVAALAAALLADSQDLPASEEGRGPALPEIAAGDARTPAELAELLADGSRAAARAIVNALDRVGGTNRDAERKDRAVRCDLVLLIDQLDELFAPSLAAETRDIFVQLLAALLATGRIWVLVTLRADLYAAMLDHPGLKAMKEAGATYDLAPPGPAELAEIVRRPAEAAGLEFERDAATGESLDERLLREADRPDMLPLVQLALARLYEGRRRERERTILPLDIYADLGGLTGIIDEAGERALAGLGPAEVARLPQLTRGLAEMGSSGGALAGTLTIRPLPMSVAAPDEARRRLVDALVGARLLTVSGAGEGGQVRLAHQRVLTDWARVRDIVAGSADFYRIHGEVERQRQRWEANRRSDLLLPRGLPLAEAQSIVERYGEDVGPETRAFIAASRARAGRAQMVTGAAAILFAAVAVGALFQWWVAREQTRLAERNFAVAREAVRGLVFNVAQGLRNVSGMRIEALRTILGTAREASDRLIATAPDDPELLRSRATMFDNFGSVYGAAGDVTSAMTSAEQAVAILRGLAERRPEDRRVNGDVSVALVNFGSVTLQAGRLSAALRLYEEALAFARKGVAQSPDDAIARGRVTNVLDRLGNARLVAGDQAGALAAYEELLTASRTAATADPSALRRRELSIALANLGFVQLESDDLPAARGTYGEAAAISRRLAAENPSDVLMLASHAVATSNLGDIDLKAGDGAAANAKFDEALVIYRDLLRRDPENTGNARQVGVALEKRGDGAYAVSDWTGAAAFYAEELAIFRRLVALDPADAAQLRSLGVALDRAGDIRLKTGDLPGAAAAQDEVLELRRKLADRQPGSAEAKRDLNVALGNVGERKQAAGDRPGALAAYHEAIAIATELAGVDPTRIRSQRDLLGLLEAFSAVQTDSQDFGGAAATVTRQVAINRLMVEARPSDRSAQVRLGVALLMSAGLKFVLDDRAGSFADTAAGVALFRGWAGRSRDAGDQRNLALALTRQGEIAQHYGERDLALASFTEAVDLHRALAVGGSAARIELAAALVALGGVASEPEPLLREAAAVLAGLTDANLDARSRRLQANIAERLSRLP